MMSHLLPTQRFDIIIDFDITKMAHCSQIQEYIQWRSFGYQFDHVIIVIQLFNNSNWIDTMMVYDRKEDNSCYLVEKILTKIRVLFYIY